MKSYFHQMSVAGKCRLSAFSVACFGLFSVMVSSASPIWNETRQLSSDGAIGSSFGASVAIHGNLSVVGAPFDFSTGTQTGAFYVIDATTGQQLFKLFASDGGQFDMFGGSAALNGTLALVGARGDGVHGANSGSAYLFDVVTGQQLFKLTASDGNTGDQFSFAVAMNANKAIVGAIRGDGNAVDSGAVYVFDVSNGQLLMKLAASDGDTGDVFGRSVAVDGNILVVGATSDADNGTDSGSAYIFDLATGQELFKLHATDAAAGDKFGLSTGIDGNTVIIGAPLRDENGIDSGASYMFNASNGQQIFKLVPSDGTTGSWFGQSVSISGANSLIGAAKDGAGGVDSGAAYVFDVSTGQEGAKITAPNGLPGDRFGSAVSLDSNLFIVGAAWRSTFNGAAYVFVGDSLAGQLTVSPNPLVGSQTASFVLDNALPNQSTYLIYSLVGRGSKYSKSLGVTLPMDSPILVQSGMTDANGHAQYTTQAPNVSAPANIWFVVAQSMSVSNGVATQIIP